MSKAIAEQRIVHPAKQVGDRLHRWPRRKPSMQVA